jgi:hypothetical protein
LLKHQKNKNMILYVIYYWLIICSSLAHLSDHFGPTPLDPHELA